MALTYKDYFRQAMPALQKNAEVEPRDRLKYIAEGWKRYKQTNQSGGGAEPHLFDGTKSHQSGGMSPQIEAFKAMFGSQENFHKIWGNKGSGLEGGSTNLQGGSTNLQGGALQGGNVNLQGGNVNLQGGNANLQGGAHSQQANGLRHWMQHKLSTAGQDYYKQNPGIFSFHAANGDFGEQAKNHFANNYKDNWQKYETEVRNGDHGEEAKNMYDNGTVKPIQNYGKPQANAQSNAQPNLQPSFPGSTTKVPEANHDDSNDTGYHNALSAISKEMPRKEIQNYETVNKGGNIVPKTSPDVVMSRHNGTMNESELSKNKAHLSGGGFGHVAALSGGNFGHVATLRGGGKFGPTNYMVNGSKHHSRWMNRTYGHPYKSGCKGSMKIRGKMKGQEGGGFFSFLGGLAQAALPFVPMLL